MLPKKNRFFTEERTALIIRWWAAAAVYFFIGWGTNLGFQTTSIDFIFFLTIGIGVFEMFVVGPVIRNMFRTREGLRWRDMNLKQRVLARLGVFARSYLLVLLVFQTYKIINVSAIALLELSEEAVFLPGEPILFGVFYIAYYIIFTKLVESVRRRMEAL